MFTFCPPKDIAQIKSETFPDGKRYYTTPNGDRLPSVTTVLGLRKKESILEWRKKVGEEEANRISSKASGRGTRVHKLCENYIQNDENYAANAMPDAFQMFKSIKPIIDKNINNIHYQEQSMWSTKIGMAGTTDLIAEFDGTLSVIDFKTSAKYKKKEWITDYFTQCSTYSLMYEELIGTPIHQVVIIMAVEDSKPLVFVEKVTDYMDDLADAIEYYRRNSK